MGHRMRFALGDSVDVQLCKALTHEFLRCDDAFSEFFAHAQVMIARKDQDKRTAYRCYNAYVRFLHHLYEFQLGAVARDRLNTASLDHIMAGKYIMSEIERIMENRRDNIRSGTAPAWENDLSYYEGRVPADFADRFRDLRNKSSGHVKYERAKLNVSEFYRDYHKYVYLMYFEAKSWWGRRKDAFPDLDEITAFTVLLEE